MNTSLQLIAAPFTPFGPDGALDLSVIPAYVDKLCRDGVAGVFVCGTTGEGLSLSEDERKALAQEWRTRTAGRLRLIVHAGHTCLENAMELSRHAQTVGADGVASIGPVFFAPSSPQSLAELYAQIAASAPDIPFYYYHMPSMSRVTLNGSECFSEMAARIPNFGGIKFTHEDIPDFQRCLRLAAGTREVFFGRDEILLQGLVSGARSAVGSTYNFAAPLYAGIHEALNEGRLEDAASLQALCVDAIRVMVRFNGLSGIRATLALCGIDCGSPRGPLESLSLSQIKELESALEEIGYLGRIRK